MRVDTTILGACSASPPTDLQAASAAGVLTAAASWGHLYDPQAPADLTLEGPEDAPGLLSR